MSGSSEAVLYKKGENPQLDKKLEKYRKMRVWSGNAPSRALTDDDLSTLANLWQKEKLEHRKLTVEDVSKLVELADSVREYRAAAEREKSRQRMERARNKLRKAEKDGDCAAIRKIKKIKSSSKKRAARLYKRQQEKKVRTS